MQAISPEAFWRSDDGKMFLSYGGGLGWDGYWLIATSLVSSIWAILQVLVAGNVPSRATKPEVFTLYAIGYRQSKQLLMSEVFGICRKCEDIVWKHSNELN